MITDMPHGGNEKVDWLHDLKDNFFFGGIWVNRYYGGAKEIIVKMDNDQKWLTKK